MEARRVLETVAAAATAYPGERVSGGEGEPQAKEQGKGERGYGRDHDGPGHDGSQPPIGHILSISDRWTELRLVVGEYTAATSHCFLLLPIASYCLLLLMAFPARVQALCIHAAVYSRCLPLSPAVS